MRVSDITLVVLLLRYEVSTKDVSKWQSIVKANREAPTLKFAAGNKDVPRTSTTGALIAKFQPSRDFEKEIAAMLAAAGAHNEQAVQEAEEALALKVGTLCAASQQTACPMMGSHTTKSCRAWSSHATSSCCVALGETARAPMFPGQPACLSHVVAHGIFNRQHV